MARQCIAHCGHSALTLMTRGRIVGSARFVQYLGRIGEVDVLRDGVEIHLVADMDGATCV